MLYLDASAIACDSAGKVALAVEGAWDAMRRRTRNLGVVGLVRCAMAAVDVALWDLAAKAANLPLFGTVGVLLSQPLIAFAWDLVWRVATDTATGRRAVQTPQRPGKAAVADPVAVRAFLNVEDYFRR